MEAVNNTANDAIILCGETGSGKSTQVTYCTLFNVMCVVRLCALTEVIQIISGDTFTVE